MRPDHGGRTTQPSCRELVERLGDLVDGSLRPGEAGRLRWHLSGCEDCRRYLASYRATLELLRGAGRRAGQAPDADELVGSVMAAWRRLGGGGSP